MSQRRRQEATVAEPRRPTLELVRSTSTELFAERGFAATTMRHLADRAGLPPSAFYYYFRSKYEVLLAIMDVAMCSLEDGVEIVAGGGLPPEQRLVALVSRHVVIHLEDPQVARVADGELRSLKEEDRDAIVARRDAYERHLRNVLVDGVEAGRFPLELDIPVASMSILTMATGVVHWWRPEGRHSIDETAQFVARFALGLASAGARP